MAYFDRTDVSESIDVNKTSASKVLIIWHYWYFLDKGFKVIPDVWGNGFHDVLITSMNVNNIAILNICGVDYCCIINGISKVEAIKLLQIATLNEKNRRKVNVYYSKMSKRIIAFGIIEIEKQKFH